ncbi:MAG: hypothetical protein ACI9S8_001044 [Chlamydiales bacterium]|jgi:hypothetical protein
MPIFQSLHIKIDQQAEAYAQSIALNKMTSLGMPKVEKVVT